MYVDDFLEFISNKLWHYGNQTKVLFTCTVYKHKKYGSLKFLFRKNSISDFQENVHLRQNTMLRLTAGILK